MKRRTILQLILILPFIKISHFIKTFYKKKKYKKYTWILKSDD